jgi:hypothetical protein
MPSGKILLIKEFAPIADSFPFLPSQQKRKNITYLRVLCASVVKTNKFQKPFLGKNEDKYHITIEITLIQRGIKD